MLTTIEYPGKENLQAPKQVSRPRWKRMTLPGVLGYQAAGCLFGTTTVWMGATLVADVLLGGAALDAVSGAAEPSSARALLEGTILIYNSSTAFVMTAFILSVAGYAPFATGVLQRWTSWVAYAAALLCIACVPAMHFGKLILVDFKTLAISFIIASVLLIRATPDATFNTGLSL